MVWLESTDVPGILKNKAKPLVEELPEQRK